VRPVPWYKEKATVRVFCFHYIITWNLHGNVLSRLAAAMVVGPQWCHAIRDNDGVGIPILQQKGERVKALAQALTDSNLPSFSVKNIYSIMYSKLLLNLLNAINVRKLILLCAMLQV
jgi:hypothetical protein